MQVCPSCGEENPARFRLCGLCGTPLAPALPAAEIRKTVTIVFSDLKGSTHLGERLDSESLREIMTRYFEAMRAELEGHGGTIEKYIGDAIMAVFGLPTLHEDDALRAVRAAAGMQRALAGLNDELDRGWGVRLANRTGVNTGEIVAGDPTAGQRLVTGDAVNTAARLEQAAPTNEVLLGGLTYRLVRDAVEVEPVEPLELKGKADRVAAYRLLSVRSGPPRDGSDASPMVGRSDEMGRLREAFGLAVEGRTLRTVTIIGDAGVGKSRLTREFLASIGEDAFVVRGRCLPYGRGITFWPLVEIVRRAAEIDEDDPPERARARLLGLVGDREVADRIASATGLAREAFPLAEVFWAVRRLVEILAERSPLVVVFDDIHWAEPTLLDLLEHLSAGSPAIPALVVCTARHDLLEDRPAWGEGPGTERILLGPLGEDDAGAIVVGLLGGTGLPAAVRDRVIAAAEGNPLFVEQLVSMLVDDGVLSRVDGDWRLADESRGIRVPPTIQALLAARLDRLGREERAVVEPASVVGLVFQEAAVRWLAPEAVRAGLAGHLAALDRKQFIHPTQAAVEGEASFRFHHILIRDAAYNGLLKRTRASLHERFVEWADAVNADRDRALEFQEILGYHLEQAQRYLAELGPLDDHGIALGARAAERLATAGRRAFARGDMPAAANLLGRAAALLPVGAADRPTLLIEAGEAMTEAGELTAADEVLGSAVSEAASLGDTRLEVTARLGRLYLHYITEGDEPEEQVVDQVRAAIEVLEAAGDQRGLSRAWRILTNVHFAGCRYLDATAAAERMIEHARLAGDRAMELRVLPALATCAQLGPTPVPRAIGIAEHVLSQLGGDRKSEAYTLRALANLEAMRGRFDEARSLYRRSRATLDELGWRFDAALTSAIASGPVELIAGDAEAAEAELRRDHEALAAMGERNYISTTAAFLAEALYRQRRDDEALRMTEQSEEIAAADDVATQYLWRSVRAKLLARQGRFAEAETLAGEAIRIIEGAQDPDSQGYAYLDLSDVLRMAGRTAEAIDAAERAVARFALKGNTSSAARAMAAVRELAAAG
jgi:class 3 adenylate cyclase/tetratricopeptide (TPR) repeat protein